jgi:hypothetical protein
MRALMLLRPSHPIPTFVTMANAPFSERDGGDKPVIWVKREVEFFSRQNLTTKSVILGFTSLSRPFLIQRSRAKRGVSKDDFVAHGSRRR